MTGLTPEILEILDYIWYTTREHCCFHFADMIDSGQGIGSSDISICVNEILEYIASSENLVLDSGLVRDMIHETLLEMEKDYA